MTVLDQNGDHKVSGEEFVQVMDFLVSGLDDEEFDLFIADSRIRVGAKASREVLLRKVFRKLDIDSSGYIEVGELRKLVGHVAPAESTTRAYSTLSMFDNDGDARVSLDEFLSVFEFLAQDMDEAEFSTLLTKVSVRGFETFFENDYRHPHGVKYHLDSSVVPTLRQGLMELVKAVEQDKLEVGAGVHWDDGAHLPRGWRPFSPLRWLADWIMAQPGVAADTQQAGAASREASEEDVLPGAGQHKAFEAMNRAEQLALLFKQLDVHGSRALPGATLVATARRMEERVEDMAVLEGRLAAPGVDLQGNVGIDGFVSALSTLLIEKSEADFREAVRAVLALRDWRYCRSREEKFRYLFHYVDLDRSGTLSISELKVMALRMDPGASADTINATLGFLDRDASDSVSEGEFVGALSALLSEVEEEAELDDAVQRMLNIGTGSVGDPADEVEPEPLATLARNLKTHRVAAQLPASIVMDKLTSRQPIVLIDVRSEEERAVSTMPGALTMGLTASPGSQWGYVLTAGADAAAGTAREALAAAGAAATAAVAAQPPVVVAYCNTGERAGVAALLLGEAMRATVYNMCGGIINYYNQGGNVFAAAEEGGAQGKQVQSLHPGAAKLRSMVTRPNNFRLEA